MKKRVMSGLWRAVVCGAVAAVLWAPWANAQQAGAAARLNERLSFDSLRAAYARVCGDESADRLCFLRASDLGLGDADHVLAFRGENQIFPKPLSSSISRSGRLPRELCAADVCSTATVIGNLSRLVVALIAQVSGERPGFYGAHVLTGGCWVEDRFGDSPLFDDKKKPGVPDVLASAHFRGVNQVLRAKVDDTEIMLDPFVSLTPSPKVAHKFATSFDHVGRIWVISVPAQKVKKLSRGDCRDSNYLAKNVAASELYDFSACVRAAVYGSEKELDTLIDVPKEWIVGAIEGL